MTILEKLSLSTVVIPENLIRRRNPGLSDRSQIASPACTRWSFFPSFQHSETHSVAGLCSNWNYLRFGTNSPR